MFSRPTAGSSCWRHEALKALAMSVGASFFV
jgi:hypothetical protein